MRFTKLLIGCLAVGAALSHCSLIENAQASSLTAFATFRIGEVGSGRSDEDSAFNSTGVTSASVLDAQGKASARATADYGTLHVAAEVDPDTGQYMTAGAECYFDDVLVINGANSGDAATIIVRFRVTGEIQQPLIVADGYAPVLTVAQLSVSSEFASKISEMPYLAEGLGSPIRNEFDDILEVSIPFKVGEEVELYAYLGTGVLARDLTLPPDVETFSAAFDSFALLAPVELRGVVNPIINSESGTHYAIIPEPNARLLLLFAFVSCIAFRQFSFRAT